MSEYMHVRFLEANCSARGAFAPGDETDVPARRARIWSEGGVVLILPVSDEKKLNPPPAVELPPEPETFDAPPDEPAPAPKVAKMTKAKSG